MKRQVSEQQRWDQYQLGVSSQRLSPEFSNTRPPGWEDSSLLQKDDIFLQEGAPGGLMDLLPINHTHAYPESVTSHKEDQTRQSHRK